MKKTTQKIAAGAVAAGIITISAFYYHTPKEQERNIKAAVLVDQTIKSECFEKEWMASSLDEGQTNGLTKAEVLNKYRTSSIIVELEMYRSRKNTVGYTYSNTMKIWMNRKFHDNFTACEVASNFGHEGGHKIGFGHDVKATKRRPFSVPYMVGTIIKKCCHE